MASRAIRVHSTSNTGALRIHWDDLKNSTDRLTERNYDALSIYTQHSYICAKLILSLIIKSENLLAIG